MSIKAIFYSKFDPHEGPRVVHQVPEDSILVPAETDQSTISPKPLSSTSSTSNTILSFSSISRFIIPRQSLCGNLISLRPPPPTPQTPPCLILSYPICLSSHHYARNEFIFNFALVLSPPDTIDVPAYKAVVTKLAHLMRSLEVQSHFLSNDSSPPNTGKIYSLCEMLMEDLNNYCECMIPIDDLNTLNIKIFPTLPNPPSVKSWHVPLLTVRISTLMDETWDLTMQRVMPFIDGVRSVKKIAVLADADLKLTKKCVKHLLYYGCVLLLDIFSFNAIYAPTAEFEDTIVKETSMQRECAKYVNLDFAPNRGQSRKEDGAEVAVQSTPDDLFPGSAPWNEHGIENIWPLTTDGQLVDGVAIVQLFANLRQDLTVREWYSQNSTLLANIDMRRFLTFGVIKGFLYRVHRYPFATGHKKDGATPRQGQTTPPPGGRATVTAAALVPRSMSSEIYFKEGDPQQHSSKTKTTGGRKDPPILNLVHNGRNGHADHDRHSTHAQDDHDETFIERVKPFLDGTHCFDEICTELEISERDLEDKLKHVYPEEVVIICK